MSRGMQKVYFLGLPKHDGLNGWGHGDPGKDLQRK